jgi:hypothetical protein
MNTILDLRKKSILSVEDAVLINNIEPAVRVEYNNAIEKLILDNKLSSLSLLLPVTCRNTITSPILDTLCRVALVEEKLKNKDIPSVIYVENRAVADLIHNVLIRFKLADSVDLKISKSGFVLKYILMNAVKSLYLVMNDWFWFKLMFLKKRPAESIVYIDNFLFTHSFDDGKPFYDRYYTGHDKFLSESEKRKEWFAPTIVGMKSPLDYYKLGKGIRNSETNFLLQEAWLKTSDFLYSFFASFFLPLKIRKYPKFRELNLKPLLLSELKKNTASPSLMRAIYRYRFIRRLSKEKVKINGVIDWSENNINDRAMNLGFKNFYPGVLVHGYQGFPVLEQFASLQPTCYEHALGTIPDTLYVVSEFSKERMLTVCNKLDVKVAPAFRFSHLFVIQDRREESTKIVLLALPIVIDEVKSIVKAVINLATVLPKNVKFLLKSHPSYTKEKLEMEVPQVADPIFEYTNKIMPILLESASVVISSASSVAVEAISVGIPVAIHGNRSGISFYTIPSCVPEDMWSVFYTLEQLENFVTDALTKKERNCIAEKLFQPVDKIGTKTLFNFS